MLNTHLFIGFTTKQSLQKLLNEGDISEHDYNKFYKGARTFFITAAEYVIKTYPLKDDLLKHAKFVDFENQEEATFSSVEYFIYKFPHFEPLRQSEEIEVLAEDTVP